MSSTGKTGAPNTRPGDAEERAAESRTTRRTRQLKIEARRPRGQRNGTLVRVRSTQPETERSTLTSTCHRHGKMEHVDLTIEQSGDEYQLKPGYRLFICRDCLELKSNGRRGPKATATKQIGVKWLVNPADGTGGFCHVFEEVSA